LINGETPKPRAWRGSIVVGGRPIERGIAQDAIGDRIIDNPVPELKINMQLGVWVVGLVGGKREVNAFSKPITCT